MMNHIDRYSYSLDLTGVRADNRVDREEHVVSLDNKYIALKYGAFFTDSVKIIRADNGEALIRNTDFKFYAMEEEAVKQTGKDVATLIRITSQFNGKVFVSYQVVGGQYENTSAGLTDIVNRLNRQVNPTYWKDIHGVPDEIFPKRHLHHYRDIVGITPLLSLFAEIAELMKERILGDNRFVKVQLAAMRLRLSSLPELSQEDLNAMKGKITTNETRLRDLNQALNNKANDIVETIRVMDAKYADKTRGLENTLSELRLDFDGYKESNNQAVADIRSILDRVERTIVEPSTREVRKVDDPVSWDDFLSIERVNHNGFILKFNKPHEVDSLENKVGEHDRVVDDHNTRLMRLRYDVSILQTTTRDLGDRLNTVDNSLSDISNRLQGINENYTTTSQLLSEATIKLGELENRHRNLNDDFIRFRDTTTETNADQQSQITNIQNSLDNQSRNLGDRIDELSGRLVEQRQQIDNVNGEQESKLGRLRDDLNDHIERFNILSDNVNGQNANVSESIREVYQEISRVEGVIRENKLDALNGDDTLRQRIDNLENSHDSTVEQVRTNNELINHNKVEIDELKRNQTQRDQTLATVASDVNRLKEGKTTTDEKLADMDRMLENHESELRRIEELNGNTGQEIEREIRNVNERMNNELEQLRNSAESDRDSQRRTNESLREDIDRNNLILSEDLGHVRDGVNELYQAKRDQETQVQQLGNKAEQLRADTDALKGNVGILNQTTENLNRTTEGLRADLDNTTNKANSNDNRLDTLEPIVTRHTDQLSTLSNLVDTNHTDINRRVDNLKVGGENLFGVGSEFPALFGDGIWWGYHQDDTGYAIRYGNPHSDRLILKTHPVSNLVGLSSPVIVSVAIRYLGSGNVSLWGQPLIRNKWIRVSKKLELPTRENRIYLEFSGTGLNTSYDIRELQVEYGDLTTPWKPSREEINHYTRDRIGFSGGFNYASQSGHQFYQTTPGSHYNSDLKMYIGAVPARSDRNAGGILLKNLNFDIHKGETVVISAKVKVSRDTYIVFDVNNETIPTRTPGNDHDHAIKRRSMKFTAIHDPLNPKPISAGQSHRVWFSYTSNNSSTLQDENSGIFIVNNHATDILDFEISEIQVEKADFPSTFRPSLNDMLRESNDGVTQMRQDIGTIQGDISVLKRYKDKSSRYFINIRPDGYSLLNESGHYASSSATNEIVSITKAGDVQNAVALVINGLDVTDSSALEANINSRKINNIAMLILDVSNPTWLPMMSSTRETEAFVSQTKLYQGLSRCTGQTDKLMNVLCGFYQGIRIGQRARLLMLFSPDMNRTFSTTVVYGDGRFSNIITINEMTEHNGNKQLLAFFEDDLTQVLQYNSMLTNFIYDRSLRNNYTNHLRNGKFLTVPRNTREHDLPHWKVIDTGTQQPLDSRSIQSIFNRKDSRGLVSLGSLNNTKIVQHTTFAADYDLINHYFEVTLTTTNPYINISVSMCEYSGETSDSNVLGTHRMVPIRTMMEGNPPPTHALNTGMTRIKFRSINPLRKDASSASKAYYGIVIEVGGNHNASDRIGFITFTDLRGSNDYIPSDDRQLDFNEMLGDDFRRLLRSEVRQYITEQSQPNTTSRFNLDNFAEQPGAEDFSNVELDQSGHLHATGVILQRIGNQGVGSVVFAPTITIHVTQSTKWNIPMELRGRKAEIVVRAASTRRDNQHIASAVRRMFIDLPTTGSINIVVGNLTSFGNYITVNNNMDYVDAIYPRSLIPAESAGLVTISA